jgi:hypothetical protein
MKLGNRADAAKCLRAARAWQTRYTDLDDMYGEAYEGEDSSWGFTFPNGVHYIGAGAFRMVFTVDNEVAYKIPRYKVMDCDINREEWRNYKKYSHLMPEGFRLPRMDRVTVDGNFILAAELIKFPRQDCQPHHGRNALPFRWDDCGSNNYRTAPDGTTIILDFP